MDPTPCTLGDRQESLAIWLGVAAIDRPRSASVNGEARTRRHALFFSIEPKPGLGSGVFASVRDVTVHRSDAVAVWGAVAQVVGSLVTIVLVF